MSLKFSIPSVEALPNNSVRSILANVRDNLLYMDQSNITLDDLVTYGLLRKNAKGEYYSPTSSTSSSTSTSTSSGSGFPYKKIVINGSGLGVGSHLTGITIPVASRVVNVF